MNKTWLKPLIASLSTLMMWALLSACQFSNAKTRQAYQVDSVDSNIEFSSQTQHRDNLYNVNGKRIDWDNLTNEQISQNKCDRKGIGITN